MQPIDYSNETKETLSLLPLPQLRLIGRDLGVKSPTSLKKEQLIADICGILENKKIAQGGSEIETQVVVVNPPEPEADDAKNGGRPPKNWSTIYFNDIDRANELKAREIHKEDGYMPSDDTTILFDVTVPVEDAFEESGKRRNGKDGNNTIDKNKSGKKGNKIMPKQKTKPITETGTETKEDTQITVPNIPKNIKINKEEGKEDITSENDVTPAQEDAGPLEIKEGVLEIMPDGYGFLRAKNYEGSDFDAYISAQKIKKCGLRKGDWIKGEARKTIDSRPAGIINLLSVNGRNPETVYRRKNFDNLIPIYPDSRLRLETDGAYNDFAIRCIDLVAPIGKGQRAMIVSPPKAGKTTLLKNVARSISTNYPKAHLIVLLIDERPEEVTDMKESIKGEVVYSTFDETPEHHTKAAELVLERAKRLVELDEDVVILMDSLTRLARAYNLTIAPTGRTLSGGIDPGALHSPKRFFGAARNIKNGGSLTIIATALIDTGSRMDDVIYEEFKGTGNMEIHLDRRLTEKRIFPAIDLNRSGTRREELLLTQKELESVWRLRRMLNSDGGGDASEQLISELVKTKTNAEFIEQIDLKIRMMQKQGFWKN